MTQPTRAPDYGATVRTTALEEHQVRITAYGDLLCFDSRCGCDGPKQGVILRYADGQAVAGTDRTSVTLGQIVAAVEEHRFTAGQA